MQVHEKGDEFIPEFSPEYVEGSVSFVPASLSEGTLAKWSAWYHWTKRANAYDSRNNRRLEQKRDEELDRRYEKKINTELDQVEEFRSSMIVIGRSMVAYGSYMMQLLDTTTRVFPQGQPLDSKAIAKLKDVAFIYRACCTDGIPKGQEVWAQGLGIQDAIDIVAKEEGGDR
jgi:aconitase B